VAVFEITDPKTKRTLEIEGDSPPTEAELEEIFSTVNGSQPAKPSLIRQGLDALTVPEQKSREGLQMMAQMVSPQQETTGSLPRDIAMNLPRIGMETLAETAPSFISRAAILTAGALRGVKEVSPVIKAAGRGAARAAESISGLEYKTPGIIREAATNAPTLRKVKDLIMEYGVKEGSKKALQEFPLLAPGRKAASEVYEAAKTVGGKMNGLSGIPEKKELVKTALKMAKNGQLNATQALEARKELSAIENSVTGEYFRNSVTKLNKIIKPVFGKADEIFATGVRSDELRRFFPVNKSGGTSIMKSTLGTIAGIVPAMAMSPIVQGTVATSVGSAARAAAPLVNNALTAGPTMAAAVKLKDKKEPLSKKQSDAVNVVRDALVKKETGKPLTKEVAYELLKEAGGNKRKARRLAKARGYTQGYTPEGGF